MNLKSIWQGFNQWRRRGMPFRVTVLLLIGVAPVIEYNMTDQHIPLINELVWSACRAIRYSSEPRVTSTLLRGYKVRESLRLQKLLRIEFADKKIHLNDAEQLELQKLPSKVSLLIVFNAAKRNNLLATDASLRRLNRELLATVIGETKLEFDNQWLEVKSMVYQKPDLTKWATWRGKIDNFIYLFMMILPLPLYIAILWGIIFFTIAFIMSGGNKLRWFRNSTAIIIPLIIIFLLMGNPFLEWLFNKQSWDLLLWWNNGFYRFIYSLIFALIAVIYGVRLKCKLSSSDREWWWRFGCLTISGLIFLFPFGFYSKNSFGWYWFYSLSGLRLNSLQLLLPMEITGTVILCWAIMLFRKQLGTRNIKYIDITFTELGLYLAWLMGGIILFNRWVIEIADINTLTRVVLYGNRGYNSRVHLDLNFALLVIAMLIGFSLLNFKQLTKTEKIVNNVMLVAMLVVFSQLVFA